MHAFSSATEMVSHGIFRLGGIRNGVVSLCGDDVGRRCGRIWGMDEEGEINGIWREPGIRGLWPVMGKSLFEDLKGSADEGCTGNLALCRFYSKHLAMRKCQSLMHFKYTSGPNHANRNQVDRGGVIHRKI